MLRLVNQFDNEKTRIGVSTPTCDACCSCCCCCIITTILSGTITNRSLPKNQKFSVLKAGTQSSEKYTGGGKGAFAYTIVFLSLVSGVIFYNLIYSWFPGTNVPVSILGVDLYVLLSLVLTVVVYFVLQFYTLNGFVKNPGRKSLFMSILFPVAIVAELILWSAVLFGLR